MTKLIDWTKSTRCESHTCVEVMATKPGVHVRDGKLSDASPVLTISPSAWAAFTATL